MEKIKIDGVEIVCGNYDERKNLYIVDIYYREKNFIIVELSNNSYAVITTSRGIPENIKLNWIGLTYKQAEKVAAYHDYKGFYWEPFYNQKVLDYLTPFIFFVLRKRKPPPPVLSFAPYTVIFPPILINFQTPMIKSTP